MNNALLFLQLFTIAADAAARIKALYDLTTAENRAPTVDELTALDLQDAKSKAALQAAIDAAP